MQSIFMKAGGRRLFSSIPVIDVTEFVKTRQHGPYIEEVREACRDIGFFQVKGLGDLQIRKEAFAALKDFFEEPLEEKMKIHIEKNKGVRGFINIYEQGNYGVDATDSRSEAEVETEQRDFKQVFTMGTEADPTYKHYTDDLFGPNVWPANPDFNTKVNAYYNNTWEAARIMFSLFALVLGKPLDYFEQRITLPMNSMNCIYYPTKPEGITERRTGIGAHTDYECFTLLAQGDVQGLEVLNPEGVWHPVPPVPDTFVVNIGDMLSRWSNNTMRSTVHRASSPSNEPRQSIAFFATCNYDVLLENLTPLPSMYPSILAGDHLTKRIEEANAN